MTMATVSREAGKENRAPASLQADISFTSITKQCVSTKNTYQVRLSYNFQRLRTPELIWGTAHFPERQRAPPEGMDR